MLEYKEVKSSASCKIKNIQSILFGGQSSRFWMMRKHFNSMNRTQLDNLPFYSWECITLKLHNRDIDLVIRDEKHMQMLLKYLIYKMKTVDGQRDTAVPLLKAMFKQNIAEYT